MKEIQERNVDAYIYLMKLDAEKWTLLYDGGHKHGIMTTNISEALHSVLKKARVLPLKALVELILNKLVKYFHQHREKAENCVHPFPTRIFDKFLRIELKSREHKLQKMANIYCLVLMFLHCVEKMGQEQILMCRRYIRENVQKNLPSEFSSGLE
ncbi:hypothetical protein M9H77_04693 [Catharanthus roseus]|uniref:Uncharacterized protein n=1 Tax=Catharanthus roseus TaxID=4058 RepID=A0ACC0CEX1_CATRO|nr:hypothetical protein M9H77_04693 [Catharanthus roseus]